jgi:hypothetical protein
MRIGNGYIGSSDLQTTSTTNTECIPSPPSNLNWTQGYNIYKFSFMNYDTNCHIIINNGNPIFLKANLGFEMDEDDKPITSFKIVESGITYSFIGCF